MPFNIGPGELIIVLVIALIVVGPGKLPDVGAALGKSIKEFRNASADVQEAVKINVDTSPTPATPPAPAAQPAPVAPVATAATVAAAPAMLAPAPPLAEAAPLAPAAPLAEAAPLAPAAPLPEATPVSTTPADPTSVTG